MSRPLVVSSTTGANAASPARRVLAGAAFTLLSVACTVLVCLTLDLWVHHRFDNATPNRRGYRGPLLDRKRAGELRLAVVGGSTAYGYGVEAQQAFPALLEKELRRRLQRPVTVANLAFDSAGAYSFVPTLRSYEGLDYDAVVMYEGYNDLAMRNTWLSREESPVFRAFGYYPILPLIVNEKLAILKARWSRGRTPPAFHRPSDGARDGSRAALEMYTANAQDTARASHQLRATPHTEEAALGPCPEWTFYCDCMQAAVHFARSRGKIVFVVTQPYISEHHREQQAELQRMLHDRFVGNPGVFYVNLGDAVDLRDRSLAYDGMHLLEGGNQIIANALAGPIAAALGEPDPRARQNTLDGRSRSARLAGASAGFERRSAILPGAPPTHSIHARDSQVWPNRPRIP